MDAKQKLVVIVGPTASGKTALAIELAKEFSGEVISADSRQVYRGLDIGTEKVAIEEMQGVPHHCIDIADVDTAYTAADFKRDARAAIETITTQGNLPIVAGGTFFYVDALLGATPLPEVPPNAELRAQLETQPATALFAALQHLDPRRAATIEPHNKRRLVRALEIVEALGAVPTPELTPELIQEQYDVLLIGIDSDRDELRARIRSRAKRAVERGLVEETKQLLERGVTKERLAEIGLEYPLSIDFLEGTLTEVELIKKLEEKNWQYAKRQMTWLKRYATIQWIKQGDTSAAQNLVRTFLHGSH